ncbi:DeoC/LacD family aldolase family protein [Cryptosporidium meleagridis]|uniref:deoxyribose-phosphate aldolase n=1 Tax=Cryptosporidium meleagridis TaxID=93969 RepID=A0A2P4Z2S0_9CRYT|nr:DeoC/LacD family aldolase family protein [Cryptosporidium meleagridis]
MKEDQKEFLRKVANVCELTLYTSEMNNKLLKNAIREASSDQLLAPVSISTYPQFIPFVKHSLPENSSTALSTVVAWPRGDGCSEAIDAEIYNAVEYYKVHEIEYVVDYRSFIYPILYKYTHQLLLQQMEKVINEIARVKSLIGPNILLKVVLEIGEINEASRLSSLVRCAILGGADFIVTCTGKVKKGLNSQDLKQLLIEIKSSIEGESPCDKEIAAGDDEEILEGLQAYYDESFVKGTLILPNRLRYLQKRKVGIKLQGGVSSLDIAREFIKQVEDVLGSEYVSSPNTFRIGSSTLHPLIIQELLGIDDELRIIHTLGIKPTNTEQFNQEDNISSPENEVVGISHPSAPVSSNQTREKIGPQEVSDINKDIIKVEALNGDKTIISDSDLVGNKSKVISVEYLIN